MIELTESWQDEFDKAIRVKRRAHRYLGEEERGDQPGPTAEQPPPDALVPPNVPAIDEPRRPPEEDHRKGRVKGPTSQEQTKADSREAAVEAVWKMTASDSSLESSVKSGREERPSGDWDPTYDGFPPRDGGAGHRPLHPTTRVVLGKGGLQPRKLWRTLQGLGPCLLFARFIRSI